MDNLDYSEEEIQEQLAILGYKNISKHRLYEFKQDLDELIRHGKWKSLASPTQINSPNCQTARSQSSLPAYTKEKVSQCYSEDSGEGFFLHAGQANYDRQVLTTCQNRHYGRQEGRCDLYAKHLVAPKNFDDTLRPPLTDSYTSTPDTQERRFIKRKVLRKHKGQSVVCDESVYSEDSALGLHSSVQVATMYRMYNTQWDDDSDKNSLNSSFCSDGEHQEAEEEKVEMAQVSSEEDSRPVGDAEDSLHEASEEEKSELNNISEESVEGGSHDDDDEESCSSSCDSPVLSLMTSGYGTYRPEEQEWGDYTIAEFDQDSRGDVSEVREDEEDDRSLCSFGGFDVEPADYETGPPRVSADTAPEANVSCCGDDGLHEEVNITDTKPEEKIMTNEHLHTESKDAEAPHRVAAVEDKCVLDGKHLEDGSGDVEGGKRFERLEEEVQDLKEETNVDPDESSSNEDIKFIYSKVDFSQMALDRMCREWEGNLRQEKNAASCLEDRLAELCLSPQCDFERNENVDVTSKSDAQSAESEGISLSAFEYYIRGMTRAQSDGDLRPKPKSFIRPVRTQQPVKKTDPVAKYFQYKQLWEMFKLPGEADRRALCCEIKEQLAYQPPPPKPRRVYVPNTYTVPTDKKRSALRWEIRNDLANGLLPHKFSYRF